MSDKSLKKWEISNTYEADVAVYDDYKDVEDLLPKTLPPKGWSVIIDAEMTPIAYVPSEMAEVIARVLNEAEEHAQNADDGD